jgi:toxin-antitoxin system PIN domain toxin
MIALDTNLLIYAHRRGVPEHKAAKGAIEVACNHPDGCGVAVASIAEFFSVVTHPLSTGRPSTAGEAAAFVEMLADSGGVQVWSPGRDFGVRLLRVACDLGVSGVRVFDLQIALTAVEHGATEIWSHDADFVHLPGLRLRDPLTKPLA